MEDKMGRRPPIRILAGLLIAVAACQRGPYHAVEANGFISEIPRDWVYSPGGGSLLWVGSTEQVREVNASIALLQGRARDRDELLRWHAGLRRSYRDDPNFARFPASETTVAGVRATVISMTSTRHAEHRHRTTPLPSPVKLRETEVFFTLDGKGYEASFAAPIEIYDKYYPAFDHFLETLKVSP